MIRKLELEVKKRIEEAVKDSYFINDKGKKVTPIVETGVLPAEVIKGTPYILIQVTDILDEAMDTKVNMMVLYGTVGGSQEEIRDKDRARKVSSYGHWDLVSIISGIRKNFLTNPNFEYGVLEKNIKHELHGEVRYPFYLGTTNLKFTVPTIEMENDFL